MAGNTSYIGNNGKKQAGILLGGAFGALASAAANAYNKSPAAGASAGGVSNGRQGNGGSWMPSASGVGVGNSTQQNVKDQMNANSKSWHTADAATKKYLEQENQRLAGTLGGSLSYDPRSGTWSGSAGYDPYGDAIDQSNNTYAQIQADQERAKRAEVERAVGGLAGQKDGINQSYSDLFRQLYVDKMNAQKNLPQQMATMGYTGGLSESALMDLQNGYANSLRQGEQGRLSSLSDIDRAITDTRLQGDISIAEQAAQLAQQGLLSYQDLLNSQRNQTNLDRDFYANEKYRQEQMQQSQQDQQYGQGQNTQNAAKDEIDRMLAVGVMPPQSLIAASGYTPDYVSAIYGAYQRQNAPKTGYRYSNNEPAKEEAAPSAGVNQQRVNQLYNNIVEMQARTAGGNEPGFAANAVVRYAQNGSIGMTSAEAATLLRMFGYNPSDYLA